MNRMEREEARRWKEHQEMLKNPDYAIAYEMAKRTSEDQKRLKDILDNYGPYGYIPPELKEQPVRKLSDAEMEMQEILKKY